MKDFAGSRTTYYSLAREKLLGKHPRILNVLLVLVLISMAGFAAFLLSDILSFGSNSDHRTFLAGLEGQNSIDNSTVCHRESSSARKRVQRSSRNQLVPGQEGCSSDGWECISRWKWQSLQNERFKPKYKGIESIQFIANSKFLLFKPGIKWLHSREHGLRYKL